MPLQRHLQSLDIGYVSRLIKWHYDEHLQVRGPQSNAHCGQWYLSMSEAWCSSIPTQLNKVVWWSFSFLDFNVTLNWGTMKTNLPWNHSSHESHCIINWDGSYVCRQIQYNMSAMLVSLATIWRHLRHG